MDDATLRDLGLILAAFGGAAVGAERERSGHQKSEESHFAGIRTFTLLGGLGGGAGWFYAANYLGIAIVLLAAGVAFVLVAYAAASRQHDVDGTTEAAALVTLMAGALAGAGHPRLSGAVTAITVLLLAEKSRVHDFVERMDELAMRAAIRFTVMAVVILPLLPEGPYGPYGGIRPQELWMMVLFFSGLSFVGYVARMLVGARQGYFIAGLLGGIISSTNVTLTFARASRAEDASVGGPLGYGVIGASTVMFIRILAVTSVLSLALTYSLVPYIIAPFLIGVTAVAIAWRRPHTERREIQAPRNPLQFSSALKMAILFQLVLFVVEAVRSTFGNLGVIVSGALLGFADVDALLLSMAKHSSMQGAAATSAMAVAVGILSNMLLKLGLAVGLSSPSFRRVAGIGLGAMAVTSLVSIVALSYWLP